MDQKAIPVSQRELNAAYFLGFQTHGDPEVLEDLGIATTPESFTAHVHAGKEVAATLSRNGTPVSADTVRKLAVFCGDCLDDVMAGESCEHMSVNIKGKVKPRYPRNHDQRNANS
jgi:hypothetical protein